MYKYWAQQQVCNSLYLPRKCNYKLHGSWKSIHSVSLTQFWPQVNLLAVLLFFLNGSQTSLTIRIVTNIVYLILCPGPQNLKMVAHREWDAKWCQAFLCTIFDYYLNKTVHIWHYEEGAIKMLILQEIAGFMQLAQVHMAGKWQSQVKTQAGWSCRLCCSLFHYSLSQRPSLGKDKNQGIKRMDTW